MIVQVQMFIDFIVEIFTKQYGVLNNFYNNKIYKYLTSDNHFGTKKLRGGRTIILGWKEYKLSKVGPAQTWVVETLRMIPMRKLEFWTKWEGKE